MKFIPSASYLFREDLAFAYKTFFLGICLSITAFPMMARILVENQIAQTRFGTLAMAAGSLDDIMAWILLAALLSIINATPMIVVLAILGTIAYASILRLFSKIVNSKIVDSVKENSNLTENLFSLVMIFLMVCAVFTEKIGIYLVFGSFLAGMALPRGEFVEQIKVRMLDLVNLIFLPTFFVFSGLNTQIGLINSASLWCLALGILAIAFIGKGVACMLSAKLSGESWRESATIGALMNARGLMELIAINIGLQQKIISVELYTILVIMAVVTTLMTSPLYFLFMKSGISHVDIKDNCIDEV